MGYQAYIGPMEIMPAMEENTTPLIPILLPIKSTIFLGPTYKLIMTIIIKAIKSGRIILRLISRSMKIAFMIFSFEKGRVMR